MLTSIPRLKVCGLTRAEDVQHALACGADALGFVHYAPSPRSVELVSIAELVTPVGDSALTVLVVVDVPATQLAAWVALTGVSSVQLCGDETPADFEGFPVPVLRRVAVTAGGAEELQRWAGTASAFVLDHPSSAGGSGLSVDLEQAAQLVTQAPCLLAGGLDPECVAERIARVRPLGVDASSRLEQEPGVKHPELVRDYLQRAAAALTANHG
ncbi:MAG: phosphoribosylanthranilate isomerase [Planctomycetota bacterium]|jgi:phosphoribosylanthranilate isomerase